jgi:hypothetical protein
MQSEMPFYEGPEDALRAAVQALGGAKQVGAQLWPDKTPDAAGRLVQDCLNPSRSEKFDVTQVMFIFRKAKECGCHGPFAWFSSECGYDARPVTKAEEADRLTTVVEQASKTLANAVAQLERMQRTNTIKSVTA